MDVEETLANKIIQIIDEQCQPAKNANTLKIELQNLKKKSIDMQNEINVTKISNAHKQQKINDLKLAYNKVVEQYNILNKQHILKVEQNIKNQGGPITYLTEDNGFGLSPISLTKIPIFRYQKKQQSQICMACYDDLMHNTKCKSLPACKHLYHSQCIDGILLSSKQCLACGIEVVV